MDSEPKDNKDPIKKGNMSKELPKFKTNDEVKTWMTDKSAEYGSKAKFTSSEEYRKAYPELIKVYNNERKDHAKEGIKAMKEKGHNFGDKMHYDQTSAFGGIKKQDGVLTKDKHGIPVVKLNGSSKKVPWHKGWVVDE